jgi:hypothetical protein
MSSVCELHNKAMTLAQLALVARDKDEGVTEYLTLKAVKRAGYTPSHSYLYQESVIKVLVAIVSEELVLNAYFKGETEALKKAIDENCRGTWTQFKAAMDQNKWLKARALLLSKSN